MKIVAGDGKKSEILGGPGEGGVPGEGGGPVGGAAVLGRGAVRGARPLWPDRIWPRMVFQCFDRIWPECVFWCVGRVWPNFAFFLGVLLMCGQFQTCVSVFNIFFVRVQHFFVRVQHFLCVFNVFLACSTFFWRVQHFVGVFNIFLGVFNVFWACSTFFLACSTFFLGVFNIFWACLIFLPRTPPPLNLPSAEPHPLDRRPPDRPKFRSFFLLSRSHFCPFSLSLLGSLWRNFGGVSEGWDPPMCTFGVLALS